jgi:predicted dehydrogenase
MICCGLSGCLMGRLSAHGFMRAILVGLLAHCTFSCALRAQELRLGILGTDSSHATEFTRILNDPAAVDHVTGAKIVVAYRGGSATIPISRDRIQKFTETLQKTWSIPFVESIAELCDKSDGILLLSVDTSVRMRELTEAAHCHKPIFIDKPLGGSLADAQEIAAFLDGQHIAWFSSSSLRYGHEQHPARVIGAETWGPGKYIEGFPLDLTYYGIHSIEALYSIMGPGVVQVSRSRSKDTDVITATWADGRMGTVRLIHPESTYGSLIFREKGPAVSDSNLQVGYGPQIEEIIRFVRTGRSPVTEGETLEIFAVMDAAQQSLQHGGQPMLVSGAARLKP